ncbi:MAG TPA: hypothetical protein DDZ04_03415 [Parabacteroides sp.]|nr:hypothetical protein [Parabacteroides sp.]
MSKKNKPTPASEARRLEKAKSQPTIYTFNFKDVPADKYTEALKVLFANPDFAEAVEKRNALVKSAGRIPQGTSQMMAIINAIQQRDRKLADIMYSTVVQINLHSNEGCDFISFANLLKYYVDYSKEGMRENVGKLAANLDKITFLADMLESVLVDVKSDMRTVFGPTIEFNQFDAVQQVLTQLRGFFKSTRSGDADKPESKLYFDYSDSINEYLEKRLKTYTDKYRKLHPIPKAYTAEDMVNAVHEIFHVDHRLAKAFIKHTESGGAYIDATALAFNLNAEQTQMIDKLTGKVEKKDALNYSFAITDAVMKTYSETK